MSQEFRNNSLPYFAGIVDAAAFSSFKKEPKGNLANKAKLCTALEIRYDLFEKDTDFSAIASAVHEQFPSALLIGTIRLERDGGKFPTVEAASRISLFREILSSSFVPNFIDIEVEELGSLPELTKLPSFKCTKILVSHHNFQGIPSDEELNWLLFLAESSKASGFKVAAMSTKEDDVLPLYDFIRKNHRNFELFSLFAMGETGRESRIKSLLCGANLSYCSLNRYEAPGQLSIEESIELYESSRAAETFK
ncbi:MAG: type I 3-dehydroquinate dehydratase [Fibrobacteraceae bacterium]|nr:type I 3-dehydroquinate dehydratase [Fibrobacteraceae bacterium]